MTKRSCGERKFRLPSQRIHIQWQYEIIDVAVEDLNIDQSGRPGINENTLWDLLLEMIIA